MIISYDVFIGSFLSKISEFEFGNLVHENLTAMVDGYMKRSLVAFKYICPYDFFTTRDDETREFNIDDITEEDLEEIVDVVSDGMVVQWLKPYVNKQELLENVINTRDFTMYSPAELLLRVGNAYAKAQKDFESAMNDYSYNHGDITELHG